MSLFPNADISEGIPSANQLAFPVANTRQVHPEPIGGSNGSSLVECGIAAGANSRADLLGETGDGDLVHVELQSTNDSEMALRMVEYGSQIHRTFGKYPRQIVLCVGEAPARMADSLRLPETENPALRFQYTLSDVRILDGDALLASEYIADNFDGGAH